MPRVLRKCKSFAFAEGFILPVMMQRRGALGFLCSACVSFVAAGGALAEDPPTFTLTIKNHQFEPTELAIPANIKIKLIVRNLDATPEEFESTSLRREKVIPARGEGVVYIGPLAPGRYDIF